MELRPLDSWDGVDEHEATKGAWERMLSRCTDPGDPFWPTYGARGIKVCDRWLSLDDFIEDMGFKPVGHSLERDDVNGDYEPMNCRWIPWQEQEDNTRKTRRERDLWNRRD